MGYRHIWHLFITIRILALPAPGVYLHFCQRAMGLAAELLLRQRRVGIVTSRPCKIHFQRFETSTDMANPAPRH